MKINLGSFGLMHQKGTGLLGAIEDSVFEMEPVRGRIKDGREQMFLKALLRCVFKALGSEMDEETRDYFLDVGEVPATVDHSKPSVASAVVEGLAENVAGLADKYAALSRQVAEISGATVEPIPAAESPAWSRQTGGGDPLNKAFDAIVSAFASVDAVAELAEIVDGLKSGAAPGEPGGDPADLATVKRQLGQVRAQMKKDRDESRAEIAALEARFKKIEEALS